MMPINWRDSNGFLKIENYNGSPLIEKYNQSCSQVVKQTFIFENAKKIDNGKITFFFPKDWIYNRARTNDKFFKYWIGLASKYFYYVKYLGIKRSEELGVTFENLKGFVDSYTDTQLSIITNNEWYVFEIPIENNSLENQTRHYFSFCWVRYLFSEHYHLIVNTFARLNAYSLSGYFGKEFDEFKLMQLAHYYFSGHKGYCETYSIIHISHKDQCLYKPITIDDFNKYIAEIKKEDKSSGIFSKKGSTNLVIGDYQKFLDEQAVKKIYENYK